MNSEDFKRLEQIVCNFKEEVKAEFRHQIGIQSEHFQHKLDLVAEGHDALRKEIRDTREELSEKIKFVDFKVEVLNQKIDGVEINLNQKIDCVEANLNQKIDGVETNLNQKIDGVEANLNQKIDGVEANLNQKIDGVESNLNQKLDALAADLSAHRADTEVHKKVYGVRED
jgi:hypothetical protein